MNTETPDDKDIEDQQASSATWISGLSKDTIFWTSVIYAALLFTVAVLHRAGVINLFNNDDLLVPLSIPWFSAIGAVTISLQAIFERLRRLGPSL